MRALLYGCAAGVLVALSLLAVPRVASAEPARGATIAVQLTTEFSEVGPGWSFGFRPGFRLTRSTSLELNTGVDWFSTEWKLGGRTRDIIVGLAPGLRIRAAVDHLTPFVTLKAGPAVVMSRVWGSDRFTGDFEEQYLRLAGMFGTEFGVEIAFHDQFGFGPLVSFEVLSGRDVGLISIGAGLLLYAGGGSRRPRFYGAAPAEYAAGSFARR